MKRGDHVASNTGPEHGIVERVVGSRVQIRWYDDDDQPTRVVANIDVRELSPLPPIAHMSQLKQEYDRCPQVAGSLD